MSVVVEFDLASGAFSLGAALADEDAVVELERVVPASGAIAPLFWATAEDLDRFRRSVEGTASVERLREIDRYGDAALFEVEWSDHGEGLFEGIEETGAVLLSARWRDGWHVRLRFDRRELATAFSEHCTERAVEFDVRRVYVPDEREHRYSRVDLTAKQREALELALAAGYFATPKRVGLDELADELDITQQALSTRIRRGNERVLRSVFRR